MDSIALPSQRSPVTQYTGSGIKITRPLTGETRKSNKFAYQQAIEKRTDLVYLSRGALLDVSAPFSLPIRNAGFNLNADMSKLKFTPRSGSLPRITDWESGDSLPEKQGPSPGSQDPDAEPEPEPGLGNTPTSRADVPFTGKLVSENAQLSDAEYLTAVATEEGYRPLSDRGQNGRLVEAGYRFVPNASDDTTSVFTDGNNVIVTLKADLVKDADAAVKRESSARFQRDKQKIHDIAQHFKEEGKQGRILVTGHSLGGALANDAVRSILRDSPHLSDQLYGVTFNETAGLGGCQGPECANVVNLRIKGELGSVMDTNTTRELEATCGERSRSDMAQFTGQRCTSRRSQWDLFGRLNDAGGRFVEGVVGGGLELAQRAVKMGGGAAAEVAGGAVGASVGGLLGGAAGAVGGKVLYDKASAALVGSDALKNRTLESVAGGGPSRRQVQFRDPSLLERAVDQTAAAAGAYAGYRLGSRVGTALKDRRAGGLPPPLPPRSTSMQTESVASGTQSTQTQRRRQKHKGMQTRSQGQDVGVGPSSPWTRSSGTPLGGGPSQGQGTQTTATSTGSQSTQTQSVGKTIDRFGNVSEGNPLRVTTGWGGLGPEVRGPRLRTPPDRYQPVDFRRRNSGDVVMQDRLGPSREIEMREVQGSSPSFLSPRSQSLSSTAPPSATNALSPYSSSTSGSLRLSNLQSPSPISVLSSADSGHISPYSSSSSLSREVDDILTRSRQSRLELARFVDETWPSPGSAGSLGAHTPPTPPTPPAPGRRRLNPPWGPPPPLPPAPPGRPPGGPSGRPPGGPSGRPPGGPSRRPPKKRMTADQLAQREAARLGAVNLPRTRAQRPKTRTP